MNKHILFILFLLVLLLGSCGHEPDGDVFELNMQFALPAQSTARGHDGMRKVMGDPGSTEYFQRPRYGYAYLVYSDGSQTHVEQLLNGPLSSDDWSTQQYTGIFQHESDWIYVYNKTTRLLLINKVRTWGKLYAALSYDELPNLHVKGQATSYVPQTEDDVKNIVFDVSPALQDRLQDIYSSPAAYIYEPWSAYYGTIQNFAYNPDTHEGHIAASVFLPLYHVASKVDVKWNVQQDLHRNVRITSMKATHLYNTDCYLFRPTDNTIDAATLAGGYEIPLTDGTIGMQWEGRSYFYAIPYTNNADKCPLQLEVQTNENTSGSFKTTILNNPSSPFVPWIRGNISVENEIVYN